MALRHWMFSHYTRLPVIRMTTSDAIRHSSIHRDPVFAVIHKVTDDRDFDLLPAESLKNI